jgi:hypothetical protein
LFWDWIAQAWRATPEGDAIRAAIVGGQFEYADARQRMRPFFDSLDRWLGHLTKEGLVTFCREFERVVFALDREDFARHLGLGDDGFHDARATNVLLGEAHYREVAKDFRKATRVALEDASFLLRRHWETRYGEPLPRFDVNTSTGSNPDGGPRVRARAARDARVGAAVEHLARELRLGGGEPRLVSGGFLNVAIPNLAPGELALVFRRLAATLGEKE